MKLRSELFKEVQTRLNAGERKEQIYNELKEKYPAPSVERSLAQWPYPETKQANSHINRMLLMVWSILLALKIVQLIHAAPAVPPGAWPVLLLGVLLSVYVLYGIKNCNLISYLLVLVLGLSTLLKVRTLSGPALPVLAITLTVMALAWIQKTRLFPNVSLLLRHKKDSAGNIIF
jgi:hypothetical protein